jgi:uncharacterized protein YbbK (DUF523 family)
MSRGDEDFAAGDAAARRKIRSFSYPSLSQFGIMESRATVQEGVMERDEVILVSACLLGLPTAYDGRGHPVAELVRLAALGRVIPVCPEVAGGLPVPRPPAEIVGGSGGDVLDGRARVLAAAGEDVTEAYIRGAEAALALVRRYGIRLAVMKARSPSCSPSGIYDGTHSGRLVPGEGVTVALLRRAGVVVVSEEEMAGQKGRLLPEQSGL